MEGSHKSGSGDDQLTCPISGRKAPVVEEQKSSEDKSSENRSEHKSSRRRSSVNIDAFWAAASTPLGAIIEEPDEFGEDGTSGVMGARHPSHYGREEAFSNPSVSPPPHRLGRTGSGSSNEGSEEGGRSVAGSAAMSQRSSQMGSVLSGADVKMPGGSRVSKGSRTQSSRHSSKASAKRKKLMVTRMREATKTSAPTYSLAELRAHAPNVKASWALLLTQIPWDQLGVRLYDSIFRYAPTLQNMFSKSSISMGIKMVDMIDSMVNGLDDMAGVHKKMESLGPVHHRNSVHALEHMPVFETVVMELLHAALGDQLTDEMRKSWHWLWGWLTESMLVVEKAYNTTASIIQQSWDAALDSTTLEALGGAIYEKVFEVAPNLRHLFIKPKQIMSIKLVNIVAMLVSLSAHPETVDEVISDLGKRHVTYGVASYHVPVMKQAILTVLEQALGDMWSPETAKAWSDLWESSANAMMRAIDEGREHGAAIETVWQKVAGKTTPQKFALQLYSRLTNASPELVLVFMKAGSGDSGAAESEEDGSVRVSASNFGPGAAAVTANSTAKGVGGGGAGGGHNLTSNRRGLSSGFMSKSGGEGGHKKSAFSTVLDAIERVTGLDLDGDGTVGGDILAEDDDMDLAGATGGAKKRFSRLAWGLEIWDLITVSVELLYEPELLKQRLTVIASRFFGYGCRHIHLKSIGMALQGVIGEILIIHTKTPWSAAESLAWDWFWAYVESSMRRTLEAHEQGVAERVSSDWKAIRTAHTDEEFGDIFYSELQEVAPEMLRLFVRPRRLQFSTFVEFMQMLVRFASDPEEYFQQVKPLAIRHMKHGVTAQSVKPFGTALLAVLKRALGEKYDETSQKAWDYVWSSVSRCMADCLNVGSNLVTVALVAGEVEELQRALDLAPRGQRADWVTRVQIHDSVISPLYWAVRDGKVDMARLMIQDLLTLRADREAYYYGYDQLWDVHPDIVGVLCKQCPALLEDLFDGMMWHSGTSDKNKVRVNYYVRALYGDPDAYPDAWAAPFGVLALQGPATIFVHPIVVKVLDLKWQRFAMTWFLAIEGWYTLVLILFEAAYVGLDSHDCKTTSLRLAVGGLSALTFIALLGLLFGQIRGGQVGRARLFPFVNFTVPLPRWLQKRTNTVRLVSMGILTAVSFNDPCLISDGHPGAQGVTALDLAVAVVTLLLWAGTFQLCTLNHRLSAFIFTTGVLVSDVSRVLAVLLLIILAFATALTRLENGESFRGFDNLPNAAFTLVRRILQLDPLPTEGFSIISWIFFLLFAMMSIIGMLNILIAQLSETVSTLALRSEAFAIQHRVHLALEVESMLSLSSRRKIWAEMALHEPLPFDEGYLGPPGGVQCLESAYIMLHSKYIKDRVIRVRGEASPLLPWPATKFRSGKGKGRGEGEEDGSDGSDGSEGEDGEEEEEDLNEPSFDRPPAD